MMEKLIRSKLTEKLKSYIEFESTSLQELSLTKLSIKPMLMEQFSQALSIPLTLIKGTIDTIKINKGWDKLFAINKDDPVVLEIVGIKIHARLSNELQRSYVHKKKKKIIKSFTQSLNEKINNDTAFIKKLKEYFFDAIIIEVKNVQLEIEMALKHSIVITLGLEKFKLVKNQKINKNQFNIDKLSLSYRLKNDTKNQYIINEAFAHFVNHKSSTQSITTVIMKSLIVSVNNQNFNDIRRVIQIIKWHNSFVYLPISLWSLKPNIIGNINPKTKLRYICEMMKYKIVEKKTFANILIARRNYLKLYKQANKEPNNPKIAFELEQIEEKMEVWQIKAYRKFYHDLQKKNMISKSVENINVPEKEYQIPYENGWIRSWFKTKQQRSALNELENKLKDVKIENVKEFFRLNIEQIEIRLNIKSHCNEPFLNLSSMNNTFETEKIPRKIEAGKSKEAVEYEKSKRFSIERFMVKFDKYNGHCDQCKYFLHEDSIKKISGDSQFEDIQNFLEVEMNSRKSKITIQPVTIIFNEEIKEKIEIFKVQRIHNNFLSSENLIIYPIPEETQEEKDQSQIEFISSVQFLIPETMYQSRSEFLSLYLTDIFYRSTKIRKTLLIKRIELVSLLLVEKELEYSVSQSLTSEKQYQYEMIDILRTKVTAEVQMHQSMDNITVSVSPIKIKIQKVDHLCKLIKFLSRFKPKSKPSRHLQKLRNMRRRQSIGQEFIDACQNLNEHIVRSVVSSDITKKEKYVIKEKKDLKICLNFEKFIIMLEHDEIECSTISTNIYLFSESKSINLENQKEVIVNIRSIKRMVSNLKALKDQLEKSLSSLKQVEKKNTDPQVEGTEIKVYNLQVRIILFEMNKPKLAINLNSVELQKKKSMSTYLKLAANFVYFPDEHYLQRKICSKQEIAIEKLNLYYHEEKGYNKHEKLLKIDQLKINIKPVLLHQISQFIEKLQTPDQKVYWLVNHLVNPVSISIDGITYFQLRYKNEAAGFNSKWDVVYFKRKEMLNLDENSGNSVYFATEKLKLIKTIQQRFHIGLRSNFRIINKHDRLLCLRILKVDDEVFSHGSIKDQIQQKIISKTHRNEVIVVPGPKSECSDDEENPKNRFRRALSINKPQHFSKHTEILKVFLKPKNPVELLVQSEDYFIQLTDVSSTGTEYQIFQEFRISEMLFDKTEKNLTATWASEQIQHNLIVRTRQNYDEDLNIKIYELEILSPVIIYNYMPWQLKYRYSKEEIDVMQTIKSAGREVRKRSFQAVPMQHVLPFTSSQNRNIKYQEITEIEIIVKEYIKTFRIDHIITDMKSEIKTDIITENAEQVDKRNYKTLLCLNDGKRELQIILEINLTQNILQILLYPQCIFINMTSMNIEFNVQQEKYFYPLIELSSPKENTYFKNYLKMNSNQLSEEEILKQFFLQYRQNLGVFTGSLDPSIQQLTLFGENSPKQNQLLFNKSLNESGLSLNRHNMIEYTEKNLKIVIRKINLSIYAPINFIIFMPSLLIINKSDWNFYVKGEGEKLKKLPKHEMEYVIICSKVAIQACEEQEQICYGEWLKISLSTLGTFYYAKQMTSSNGYESRQYELRKKRLKKAPKIFYRIVMTRYEFGYQMLIEESQYPPVTFINKCKSRIKVTQVKEQSSQEMEYNQMAEYAPKLPLYEPTFSISMVQNYQFLFLGQFSLHDTEKRFMDKIKINIEEYKDKKIIIFQDCIEKYFSEIRNELLLQKIVKFNLVVDDIAVSVLNSRNREISCTCLKDIDIQHETKSTKQYIKLRIGSIQAYSYHSIQPTYLFYCKKEKEEMFKLFKKKKQIQHNTETVNIELIVDYHKHATILEKCLIKMLPITIIINANTIIDYIKYFYEASMCVVNSLKYLSKGKKNKNKDGKEKSAWKFKNFIIESFYWDGIKVIIKSENLNNFTLFIDKTSIEYLLKWIAWLGELKPLKFSPVRIQYEQYNVDKMSKLINFNQIVAKFTQILLHYPLQEIYNILSLLATIMGVNQSHEDREQIKTLKKITKSTFKLFFLLLSSHDPETLMKKMNYRNLFKEALKNKKSNFIQKIMDFKYAEWRISEEVNPYKLAVKVARFQRYSEPLFLDSYDKIHARIKLAIDSHCRNKIYRQIKFAQQINIETLLGVTQEWFTLYFIDKDEWIVVCPQSVLSFQYKRAKAKQKYSSNLVIWLLLNSNEHQTSHAKQFIFKDIFLDRNQLQKVWSYIYELKLSCIY